MGMLVCFSSCEWRSIMSRPDGKIHKNLTHSANLGKISSHGRRHLSMSNLCNKSTPMSQDRFDGVLWLGQVVQWCQTFILEVATKRGIQKPHAHEINVSVVFYWLWHNHRHAALSNSWLWMSWSLGITWNVNFIWSDHQPWLSSKKWIPNQLGNL